MRILIGIYQDHAEANLVYEKRKATPAAITEVGPFFSKDQALSWMDHLTSRIDSSEKLPLPDEKGNGAPWSGYTIEELND